MSDSVLLAQTPLLPVPSASLKAAPVVLTDVPAEVSALPAGTTVTALVMPGATTADPVVVSLSMPDGTTTVFETAFPLPVTRPTTYSLKLIPTETDGTVTVKIMTPPKIAVSELQSSDTVDVFSKSDASTQSATQAPAVIQTETGTVLLKDAPVSGGFVLKNTPPSILTRLPDYAPETPLPAGTKVVLHVESVLATPETPVASPETSPAQASVPSAQTMAEHPVPTPASAATAYDNISAGITTTSSPVQAPPDMTVSAEQQSFLPPSENSTSPTQTSVVLQPPTITPEKTETVVPAQQQSTPLPATSSNDLPQTTTPSSPVSNVDAVPLSPTSPTTETTPPQQAAAETYIGKTVKGTLFQPTQNDPTLIATRLGVFALDSKIRLPDAATVSVKLDSLLPPADAFLTDSDNDVPHTVWSIMNNALETLKDADPTAYQALKSVLPQVGDKLPALMLSYMHTAVQGGNVTAWLGENTVQALRGMGRRGEAILKNLEKEFSSGTKKASDGKSSWRAYDIPLLTGTVVEPVSLYLQHAPQADAERMKAHQAPFNSVRFVLDLSLTRLGRIQLEGLATRSTRTFNLNIRHADPLPAAFEPTVKNLFAKTLNALNYAGNLSAKQTDEFIDIRTELPDDNPLKKGVFA